MAIPDNVKSAVERLADAISGLGKEIKKSKSEGFFASTDDLEELDSMIAEALDKTCELGNQEEKGERHD